MFSWSSTCNRLSSFGASDKLRSKSKPILVSGGRSQVEGCISAFGASARLICKSCASGITGVVGVVAPLCGIVVSAICVVLKNKVVNLFQLYS